MPKASFCADFDEASTTPLALYWDEVSAASPLAAAPVRDGSISVSKPHSLFFSTSPLAANESVSVSTKKVFTQLITSEVHLSFDVFHDQRDPGGNGYYLRLRVGPGATAERHKLYYYVSDDLAYIVEEPPEPAASIRHKFSEPVPTNKWVHIDIDAIRSASSATVSARVDGALAVNAEPLQGWRVGATELSVGITYAAGPSTAQKVHFDNVWADLK